MIIMGEKTAQAENHGDSGRRPAASADFLGCFFALTSDATGRLVFVALRRTATVHYMVVIQWQMVVQAVLGHLVAWPS